MDYRRGHICSCSQSAVFDLELRHLASSRSVTVVNGIEQLWLHLVYILMLQLKVLLLRNWYTARSHSAEALRESWTAVQTLVTSCSSRGIGIPELEMRIGAASQAIEKVKVRALSPYLQLDGRNHCWIFFSYVKSSSMQRVWTLQNKKYSQA